jgi:hypothetical protein
MAPPIHEMLPKHFMLLSELPCEAREEKLKAIILAYSAFFATCREAKLELSKKINLILGLAEEENV